MPSKNVQSQINQLVQGLINSGAPIVSAPNVTYDPFVRIEDIYPPMRRYFTDKAGKALHAKVTGLLHQRNEMVGHAGLAELLSKLKINSAKVALDTGSIGWRRVADLVVFVGSACDQFNIGLATEKVIKIVNHLADKNYITGALTPLSIITLSEVAPSDARYVVISYIALTQDGQKYMEANHKDMTFTEGGMPSKVGEQK